MSFGFGFALPHWQTLSGGFNPASLFTGGVQGAFYDPSDASTLFEDTAGTTPCGTPGATVDAIPVGLMLDKSQGLALGSELITPVANQDFSSDTGYWTKGVGVTISGGAANFSAAFGYALYRGGVLPTGAPGAYYEVTFTVINYVSGSIRPYLGTSPTFGTAVSANGTYTQRFCPTSGGEVGFNANPAFTGSIDNVSIKQVSGNHAISYNTTTARPVLSARVNLLTYSEQFNVNDSPWERLNLVTVSANVAVAPDGTTTADKLIAPNSTGTGRVLRQVLTSGVNGVSYVSSFYAKYVSGELSWIRALGTDAGVVWFDIQNGVRGTVTGVNTTGTITPVGNGWYRCVVTSTASSVNIYSYLNPVDADGGTTTTGDGSKGVLIWGADLRPTNIGTSVPAYQRIADQYTYDSNGFPRYLWFNGTASGMYTPASIPFATVTSDGQARRNLLSNPTQFDATASWTSGNATISANTTGATDPFGGNAAEKFASTTTSGFHGAYQTTTTTSAAAYTLTCYVKADVWNYVYLRFTNEAATESYITAIFDLSSTSTSASQTAVGSTSGTIVSSSKINVGDNWWRLQLTGNITATSTSFTLGFAPAATGVTFTSYGRPSDFAGAATDTFYAYGAQLEIGTTATAFQNIGTDKATVFAGVRKLSDAAANYIAELSADASANNGSFAIGTLTGANYFSFLRGTASVYYTQTTYASPISNVLTTSYDIGGAAIANEIIPRVNGLTPTLTGTGTNAGTGNFGTYPLYIGSRNNGSLWLNGYLYSLIVVGAASTAAQISSTESWINTKEGTVY